MPFARIASLAVVLGLSACAQPPTPSAPAPVLAVPPVHAIKDFFRSSPKAFFRLSEDGSSLGFMQRRATRSATTSSCSRSTAVSRAARRAK